MGKVLIFHIIFLLTESSYSIEIPLPMKKIIERQKQGRFDLDRNDDGIPDVKITKYYHLYDDDFDRSFKRKVIYKNNKIITFIKKYKINSYDIKIVENKSNSERSYYENINSRWVIYKTEIPIFKKSKFTTLIKVTGYAAGQVAKEKVIDTKLFGIWGYVWGDTCYEHNHSSVNEFSHQFQRCTELNNGDVYNNLSECSTAMPGVYLPNELEELLSRYEPYEYRWCERINSDAREKSYDWDRDVTHVSSTGLKMTQSCDKSMHGEIEQQVIDGYKNLLNCFSPNGGMFPRAKRYASVKGSYRHILDNGGLKVECTHQTRRSGVLRGAVASTYSAKNFMNGRYNRDGKISEAPDASWTDLKSSNYYPSKLNLYFYKDKKTGEVTKPDAITMMHELLHLPTIKKDPGSFNFESCDTDTHNNLVDPNEFSNIKDRDKKIQAYRTAQAERDRVYACSNLCLPEDQQNEARLKKITLKICLRCLSNSNTDNLEDDKAALKDCKDFLSN